MTEELRRFRFDEFADNLTRIFKLVSLGRESVVVEDSEGEGVVIRPLEPADKRALRDDDYDAFHSAFGGWADMDTDTLKRDIYESRKSSRPPVTL